MANSCTIIVQPWFEAVGHPAQSLLNTARVLGCQPDLLYLISRSSRHTQLESVKDELRTFARLQQFRAPANSLAIATALAVFELYRRLHGNPEAAPRTTSVFFMDAHLLSLSLACSALRNFTASLKSVSALALHGPERITAEPMRRKLINRFLAKENVRLFLRTRELADAWRAQFPMAVDRIDELPSLEMPNVDASEATSPPVSGSTRFGVLGQIRPGKGLEWLVPLFQHHPEIGCLDVVGTFANPDHRELLKALDGYALFQDRYVRDQDLVPAAASVDYLVTLYEPWDDRFEAATFFLAARAKRPVIAYDKGWCGRMIKEFGCGVAVPSPSRPGKEFFAGLPSRDSDSYRKLVDGIQRFGNAHNGRELRSEFIRKVVGEAWNSSSDMWAANQ